MMLKGKWKGFYEYGAGHPFLMFAERVIIVIDLEETEEGFTGTCNEEEGMFAIPEESVISGFEDEGLVSFVKKYRKTYKFNVRGEVESTTDKEMEVHYRGQMNRTDDGLFGIWHGVMRDYDESGAVLEYEFEGIWKLSRIGQDGV